MNWNVALEQVTTETNIGRKRKMTSILDVRGVGPALAKSLAACGIKTAEDLAAIESINLLAVPKIGQPRAVSLMAAAKALTSAVPAAAEISKPASKKKIKKADKVKKSVKRKKKAEKKKARDIKAKDKKTRKKKAKDKKAKASKATSGKSKKSRTKKKK